MYVVDVGVAVGAAEAEVPVAVFWLFEVSSASPGSFRRVIRPTQRPTTALAMMRRIRAPRICNIEYQLHAWLITIPRKPLTIIFFRRLFRNSASLSAVERMYISRDGFS